MGVRWGSFGRALRAVAAAGILTAAAGVAAGASAATTSVSCVLGASPACQGLTVVGAQQGDSLFSTGTVGGEAADIFQKNTTPGNNPVSYVYFQVVPSTSLLSSNPATLYLTVQYYDKAQSGTCTKAAPCFLTYNYGSTIASAPVNGAYAGTATQNLGGTAAWKTVTWKLTQVSFKEQENNQADFRVAGTAGLAIHSVEVSLSAPAAAASTSTSKSSPATSAGTPSTSTTSAATASGGLPKTGGSPFVPVVGGLALCGGVALLLGRRRGERSSA